MSKQDKPAGNEPSEDITRRTTTLTLAAAVAAFGAAMGMRASIGWALENRTESKAGGKYERVDGKWERKGEGKWERKVEGKWQGKTESKVPARYEGKLERKVEGKLVPMAPMKPPTPPGVTPAPPKRN